MRRSPLAAVLALAGLIFLPTPAAEAGALRVSPLNLDLSSQRPAATLTLRNDDGSPVNVQVRVYRWAQRGAREVLTPTEDVAVRPPIASIEARGERIIRVVGLAVQGPGERAYRVVVDELPPPPDAQGRQVRLLMRHSIPVFVTPAAATAARLEQLQMSARRGPGGLLLTAENRGARRVRVADLRVLDATGQVISERPGLLGYVLAGAQMGWELPAATDTGAPFRLKAETDARSLDITLSPRL